MGTYHRPHRVADSLADSTGDEDDVRNAQYWSPADKVTEHSGDKPSEERAEGSCGRDQFLLYCLNMQRPRVLVLSDRRTFCAEDNSAGPRSPPIVTRAPEITPVS